jgi:hypothetical protein
MEKRARYTIVPQQIVAAPMSKPPLMMKKLDGSPGRETSLQVVNRSWGEHRSKCVDLAVLRRFLPIPIVALTGGLINAPQGSSAAALPGPLLFLGERFPAASGAVRILRIAGQIHLHHFRRTVVRAETVVYAAPLIRIRIILHAANADHFAAGRQARSAASAGMLPVARETEATTSVVPGGGPWRKAPENNWIGRPGFAIERQTSPRSFWRAMTRPGCAKGSS